MQHVREELSHLEERLEFEAFYEWLGSEDKSTLGNQCKAMVNKLLGSADDDIHNRMTKIMAEITEKVDFLPVMYGVATPKGRLITNQSILCCGLQLSPDIEKLVRGVVSESKTADASKDEFEVCMMHSVMGQISTMQIIDGVCTYRLLLL